MSVPRGGEAFGPGYGIRASSDFTGPLENGTFWNAFLDVTSDAWRVSVAKGPDINRSCELQMGFDSVANLLTLGAVGASARQGEPATMTLELFQPTFGLVELTTVAVVLDYISGIYVLLPHIASGGSGALTPQQAQQLAETHRAVSLVSYTAGPLHGGVSGEGSIDLVSPTRAVSWIATAFPPLNKVDPGTPSYHFDLGFITPRVEALAIKSTRVTFSPQFLALPEACHVIDYDLASGLVLDITELEAPSA